MSGVVEPVASTTTFAEVAVGLSKYHISAAWSARLSTVPDLVKDSVLLKTTESIWVSPVPLELPIPTKATNKRLELLATVMEVLQVAASATPVATVS
jgi:hypothetical protein